MKTSVIREDQVNLGRLQERCDTLRAERDRLREALEGIMIVGEHIEITQGLRIEKLFKAQFDGARNALKETTK
jgi:hypothetical protein